jgi:hypothetical protein
MNSNGGIKYERPKSTRLSSFGPEYSGGQKEGDWTQDIAAVTMFCTEEGCEISPNDLFWVQGDRRLCANCITMVLNAREDYIKELEETQRKKI